MNSIYLIAITLLLLYLLVLGSKERFATNLPKHIYICTDENGETVTKEKPDCHIDKSTDYYGNSYQSTKVKNYKDCCKLCKEDSSCRSWTFDQKESICRLKSKKQANRSSCPHRTSGYVTNRKSPKKAKKAKQQKKETGQNVLKYGDNVQLKAMATRWGGHDGYLSPCGSNGGCGTGVSLRPDKEFKRWEPNSNLRKWVILGKNKGTVVKYGDKVQIKATATRWGGHDGYLSPCGHKGACGANVTLRPDKEFTRWEPNSNLRNWVIKGKAKGTPVNNRDIVQIKATATRWKGHDGYLSPCGNKGGCGVDVTLRPNKEFTRWEPNSRLRDWTVIKS